MEGEAVNYVYFILEGQAAFVLPRYDNTIYILICEGDHFGLLDLIQSEETNRKNKEVWDMKR